MATEDNIDELADRFLSLWEEGWRQLAQDPETARCWTNLFSAIGDGKLPWGPPPASPSADDSATQATGRSTTTAAASVDGGNDVDQLSRRVRDLEKQISELTDIIKQWRRDT